MKKQNNQSVKRFLRLPIWVETYLSWNYLKGFLKHYGGGLYHRFDRDHVFLLSGGLAFSLFVCIVPFILILFWILGSVLDSLEMIVQVSNIIDTLIPYEQYSEELKVILLNRIGELVEYKSVAGYIGGFGLLFAASSFFSSIRTALNTIFGAKEEISLFISKLLDFLWIFVVTVIFMTFTLMFPLLDLFREVTLSLPALRIFYLPVFEQAFTIGVPFLMILLLFMFLYKFIPTQKIRNHSVAAGAFWAAVLWVLVRILFGYYIYHIAAWGQIYGTYAFIVVIAFWIYYSAAVFLIGAEIGKLYDERYLQALAKRSAEKELSAKQKKSTKHS